MKLLILVSTFLISCILADPYLYPVPLQRLETPLLVVKTQQQPQSQYQPQQQEQQIQQYFTQDTLGQYSYGYIEPLSTKQEIRTLDGITTGSYSYIDANGLLQTVDYKADEEGFHVVATNLPKNNQEIPQPVEETAEVAAAREQHLAAHRAILEGNRSASSILPQPVEDTTEVAAAKKEFFARFSAELEKHNLLQKTHQQQHLIESSSAPKSIKSSFNAFKTKSTVKNVPKIGGFTYGYQIGGAFNPINRYYLPVV